MLYEVITEEIRIMGDKKTGPVDLSQDPALRDALRQRRESEEAARREREGREEAKPPAPPSQNEAGADGSELGGNSANPAEAGEVRQAMRQGWRDSGQDKRPQQTMEERWPLPGEEREHPGVITSYSIHYTKLYDSVSRAFSARVMAATLPAPCRSSGTWPRPGAPRQRWAETSRPAPSPAKYTLPAVPPPSPARQRARASWPLPARDAAQSVDGVRITSYNVCYTKLLRWLGGSGDKLLFPLGEAGDIRRKVVPFPLEGRRIHDAAEGAIVDGCVANAVVV